MKIIVIGGSGKIGSAVAWDLIKQDDVKEVCITGRDKKSLKEKKEWIGSKKVITKQLDISKKKETISLIKDYDVAVITLPNRNTDYKAVEYAIEAKVHIVDVLEEYHRRPDAYETEGLEKPKGKTLDQYGDWLNSRAQKRGVSFIDGIGFAPGLSNVTVGEGIRKIEKADKAIARVGGIPSKKDADKHPLKYMITWAFEHVLREYMVKVKVIKGGKIKEIDAMSDFERFEFEALGKDEDLECFVTPGMPSFIYTRSNLGEFAEKTVRWQGHYQAIQTLKEAGMLDLEEIDIDGNKVVPRKVLSEVITPKLIPGKDEGDACVMWNSVKGKSDGKEVKMNYYMWEEADKKNGLSAMQRVTSFPAAIAAVFLGRDDIKKRGILAPEDCIKGKVYENFISELEKRDIKIEVRSD